MRISEAWLREWVNPPISRKTLVDQLTMAGLEVEAVSPAAPASLTGVIAARIESVAPHPEKPGLRVCLIDCGSAGAEGDSRTQLVCGAANAAPGLACAYAPPSACLPDGRRITARAVHGVDSVGMLCSAAELGLGEANDILLELPDSTAPGDTLEAVLSLDDAMIDLDLTPNRGDCLSIRGLAREVGVLNGLPVNQPVVAPVNEQTRASLPVSLADPAGCPRYLGRVIEGINRDAVSPLWLRERLRRAGLRSLDPVVDVTNLVMLELGQPMHAFDLAELSGGITVRRATAGESLTLLDGQVIDLDPDALLIADAAGAVAIAGVMGGERSSIGPDTRDVFLECAWFEPMTVAATARRHGLHTDASHRFERGVDLSLQDEAMARATALLLEITGGAAGPVTRAEAPGWPSPPPRVALRQRRLNKLAGITFDADAVDAVLARLGFLLVERREHDEDGAVWVIDAPRHRFDIRIEADLIEEICRIHGYDRIPGVQPEAALALASPHLERSSEEQLKQQMAALGFQEAVTYSFVDPQRQHLLDPNGQQLALANPMSSEQSVMRSNLLPGLTSALAFNQNRQQRRVWLFELGLCFGPGSPVRQTARLGGLIWGDRRPESWHGRRLAADFFDLKGALERLIAWTGLTATFAVGGEPMLHPGQQATIRLAGEAVGWLGRLHPRLCRVLGLSSQDSRVLVFELDAEALLERPRRRFQDIPNTPAARRDLAFLAPESVSAGALRETLARSLGASLAELTIFDVYRDKQIESEQKSIAVGLTLRGTSATLTERKIEALTKRAIRAAESELGVRLRQAPEASGA